jgi:hypothetical protein
MTLTMNAEDMRGHARTTTHVDMRGHAWFQFLVNVPTELQSIPKCHCPLMIEPPPIPDSTSCEPHQPSNKNPTNCSGGHLCLGCHTLPLSLHMLLRCGGGEGGDEDARRAGGWRMGGETKTRKSGHYPNSGTTNRD